MSRTAVSEAHTCSGTSPWMGIEFVGLRQQGQAQTAGAGHAPALDLAQARQGGQECGLARAVGSQHPHPGAVLNAQGDAVQKDAGPGRNPQVLNTEQVRH